MKNSLHNKLGGDNIARNAQNPEMEIILNTLTLLLLCTGAFQARAQVGSLPNDDDNELRLPDDEGNKLSYLCTNFITTFSLGNNLLVR